MSETRVAFALIPGEPHFSAIVKASAAITAEMDNRNIIDADRFPPHASLHICTIPDGDLAAMFTYLTDTAPANELAVPLAPGRLREGTSGYITLDLGGTEAVTALHEWVLHAAATARGYGAVPGGETVHERYGSSRIRERFVPPYSIARVNADQQRSACTIAAEVLTGLGSAPVAGFEVCDIGERSERWDVLYRLDGSGRSPFPPEGEPTSEDRQA